MTLHNDFNAATSRDNLPHSARYAALIDERDQLTARLGEIETELEEMEGQRLWEFEGGDDHREFDGGRE